MITKESNRIKLHGKIHCKKRQLYRQDLYRNQDGCCYWCSRKLHLFHPTNSTSRAHKHKWHTMEIDHIIPRCAGGSNHFSNLVGACKSCNLKRAYLYMRTYHYFIILDQESPAQLLERYNSQQTTGENNREP